MEHARFDGLVRTLGTSSRRETLRLLGGGAVAAVFARFGVEDAAAACVPPGKICKKKGKPRQKCCSGNCQGRRCVCQGQSFGCGRKCCKPGQTCQSKKCVNGNIAVGEPCLPNLPGECASGQCGCNGPNLCICREADCGETTDACTGNTDCCQGVCDANSLTCI